MRPLRRPALWFERLRSRAVVIVHDLAMIPVAWFGAYWLRFNLTTIPPEFLSSAISALPVVLFVQGAMLWYFGLYRGVWRFASIPDLGRILKAVLIGVALTGIALFLLTRLAHVPRSVFVLDGLLLTLLLGGPRFLYRAAKDRHLYSARSERVLIVGAGRAGEMLVRDLTRDPGSAWCPVGFVDDDPRKQGKEIHGVRVLGRCARVAEIAAEHDVALIMIALPSVPTRQLRRVVEWCEASERPFRILPRLADLVTGQVGLRDLREVRIEDLLGRDPVMLDWEGIRRATRGRTVLVTGGGGSIGAELCRQIAGLDIARLVIYELSEFNLYSIELELKAKFPDLPLICLLGSVNDAVAMERVLSDYRPEMILHAAAYKHVPLLEHQLRAAITNNVLGTWALANLADRYGCEAFVMISTDKAVNPGNIMGASKRAAEVVCQTLARRSRTRFITVRFGNVLGSAGSVIPLFQKQIAAGGPVTVTHPDVTRYFMTIPEACQLILQSGAMGQGGEIFVLDMGEPIRIRYLAEQLILLSGKKPDDDIAIVYSGLRPGEKLYEELFHDEEAMGDTAHPKIHLAQSREVDGNHVAWLIDALTEAARDQDEPRLRELLRKLVPEHRDSAVLAMPAATTTAAMDARVSDRLHSGHSPSGS